MRDAVDLKAPRMTADNAKKVEVVKEVEEKKVVEATSKDSNAPSDAKKPLKKSE